MASTDLGELVRARCAEKITNGKSPSKADLAWLDATADHSAQSSVSLTRNAKGDVQFEAKVYDADPFEAERKAKEIAARLRATFPMHDGTVGSPMVEVPAKGKAA
jgi:hypothetical protein